VRQYALEQRTLQEESAIEQIKSETEQFKNENARLAASRARLERFEREHGLA